MGGRGLGVRVCSMKNWWAEGGAWESSVFVSPRQVSRQLWDDAIKGSSCRGSHVRYAMHEGGGVPCEMMQCMRGGSPL